MSVTETPQNLQELREELMTQIESKILELVHESKGNRRNYSDTSSEDSALEAALELGSDYYGGTSERARHRNFRKCKFFASGL